MALQRKSSLTRRLAMLSASWTEAEYRILNKKREERKMNLQRPNANDATRTANRSRSVVPMSGLCSRCIDGCTGNCEVFKATFRGRELIYPGPFGEITAGGDKNYPVDYSHLNIQGYALGAHGLPPGVAGDPDTAPC